MSVDFSIQRYLEQTADVCRKLDAAAIEAIVDELAALRARDGRPLCLGVSAGNCGHAVNDFRKLCGIEAYAPTDNVATVDPALITPLSEAFQAVIWHGLVWHPKLKATGTRWEGMAQRPARG